MKLSTHQMLFWPKSLERALHRNYDFRPCNFPGGWNTVHCYVTAWNWWQNYITQHSFLQTPSMYSRYSQTVMFFLYIWLLLHQYLLPTASSILVSLGSLFLTCTHLNTNSIFFITHFLSLSLSFSVTVVLLYFDGL